MPLPSQKRNRSNLLPPVSRSASAARTQRAPILRDSLQVDGAQTSEVYRGNWILYAVGAKTLLPEGSVVHWYGGCQDDRERESVDTVRHWKGALSKQR